LQWTHGVSTEHMGPPLGLDVKSYFIVKLLWKGSTCLQGNYNSCLFVVFLSCATHIADPISWFQIQYFRSLAPDVTPLPVLSQHCDQCQPLFVVHLLVVFTYGLNSFTKFCEKYNIQPPPESSLSLQFFYMDVSSQASYKTVKVYLVAIQLEHLQQSLSDPNNDKKLHLPVGLQRY